MQASFIHRVRSLFFLCLVHCCVVISSVHAASPPLTPGGSTGSDPDESTWEGIVIPSTGVLPATESHPRLYFTSSFIPALQARANGTASDPRGYYASRWSRIKADADSYLGQSISSSDDVKCKAAKACAFAYVITGNTSYRQKAIDNLKAAFTSAPTEDQYVAMHMNNYALAYDWIASGLSSTDNTAIRTAVKKGATWMYDFLADTGVRSHNHRSKVGAALGTWCLAFSSDSSAQTYFNRAMDQGMRRVFKYMFTKDGIYRDGAAYYWIFTIINSTPFLWHYKNVSGVDLFPTMQPAFEWQLKASNPKGWQINNEDGWYKHTWLVTVAAAYKNTSTPLSSSARLGNLFQWRFFNSNWTSVRYDVNWTGARNQYYGWPDELILYDSSVSEAAPDHSVATIDMNAGPRGGATILRSDWKYNDAGTRWCYFEGTAMSNNHDHADALQFVIEAENAILANDNGYGPTRFSGRSSYSGPEHHNVITATGAALGDPLPTKHFITSSIYDFAEKEAAYSNDSNARHVRGIAFPGKQYFVVVDRLSATASKTWDAYYHNRGTISGTGNKRVWTTANGPWGSAAKMYTMMLPSTMTIGTFTDNFNPFGDNSTNDGAPYPSPTTDLESITALKMTQSGTSAQYLQVLVPRSTTGTAPVLTDLSAGGVLGAKVEMDGNVDQFLAQTSNAAQGAAGSLKAAATFAWSRESGGALKALSVREGTSLTYNNVSQFTSSTAISMVLDLASVTQYQAKIAANSSSYLLRILNPSGANATSATFKGSAVTLSNVGGFVEMNLAGGGDLVVSYGASGPVAPTVNITSPGTGTTFTAPASITINANAADADGTVSNVEFYQGSSPIGSDNTSPYSTLWSSVAAGSYSLTARATDNSGSSTTSSAVNVVVNNSSSSSSSAPSGSLTAAKAAQPATLSLSTEGSSDWSHWGLNAASDWNHKSGMTAQISNFTRIGAGTVNRYTDGTMTVSWSGGTPTASAAGTTTGVYVAGAGNGFQITAPADATERTLKVYCGLWKSTGKLEATLSDGSAAGVVDTSHSSTTGSANTTFTLNYKAASAGQSLTVKWTVQTSHDTAGNGTVGWQAATLASSIVVDPCSGNASPTVSISSPASGTTYAAPATITINATAADAGGAISNVEFFQGSTLLGSDASSPYSFSWNSAPSGSYTLTAKATDNCHSTTTSAAVNVTVQCLGIPGVSLTSPSQGATFTEPASITLAASATPTCNPISKVDFFNGTALLATDSTSPYSHVWAGVIQGSYSLTARATDTAGGASTSSAVTVNVTTSCTPSLTVSLTSPATGSTFTEPATVALAANATAICGTVSKVEFYAGTSLVGSDVTSPYAFNWTSVPQGIYSLTARATDSNAGTATSSAVSITVNSSSSTTPPPAGSLGHLKSAQPASLSLSTEGSADWSHWGLSAASDWNHKSGITAQISNFIKIGTGTVNRYTDGTMSVNWSGGTPTALTAGTTTGVYQAGVGNGFQISVPADTTERTLKVYCGVWKSTGKLEASLSDGSAAAIVDSSHGSTTGSANTSFSLNYKAASAGQSLTVKWTVQTSHDSAGNGTVGWQAATLATTGGSVDPCAGNTAPTASITSPATGTTYTAPASIAINASAADTGGSISKVEFLSGSTLLGSDTSSPYSLTWGSVAAGSYSLSARATDNCGAATTSSAVNVTVNSSSSTTSTPPPPPDDYPAPLRTVNVSSSSAFSSAIASAQPGDHIVLANGSYSLGKITKAGTAANPIVIKAANRTMAVVNAGFPELASCSYVIIEGLKFTTNASIKLTSSKNCRLTRNVFQLAETSSLKWILIQGAGSGSNRIDHNDFGPKRQLGNFITFDGDATQATQNDRVDHNYFHDIGPRATNEMETIRLGWSQISMSSAKAIIEYNLFVNCDGDPEIVSVKSCDNIVRYNTFRTSAGVLSSRHGDRNSFYGNFFLGGGKSGTGGIRVYGKDHKIYNNYFEGLTGTGYDAPIALDGGDVDNSGALNAHWRVYRAVVAYNTLVNNGSSNIEIGKNYSLAPVDCVIANNIVKDDSGTLVQQFKTPVNLSWQGNIMFPTGSATLGISKTQAEIWVTDPLLSLSGGLQKLSGSSPAIDYGKGTYTYVTEDLDGHARGSLKDAGADEYSTASVVRKPLTTADVGINAP